MAQLAQTLSWLQADGPSNSRAADRLVDTWLCHPDLAQQVAASPWVVDGIEGAGEDQDLWRIQNIACGSEVLAGDLLAVWNTQGFPRHLLSFVDPDIPLKEDMVRRLLGLPWAVDGLTEPEIQSLLNLQRRVLVNDRLLIDEELVIRMLDMNWVKDGITEVEAEAVSDLTSLWKFGETIRETVFGFPWVLDGISATEGAGIWGLSLIAYTDKSLAAEVLDSMSDLLSVPGDLAVYALHAVGQIGEFPENLRPLAAKPWFADGLEPEEAAFLTALMPIAYDDPRLYADLLRSHFSLSETVSLPLAGPMNLWAFQNAPFPEDDDVLTIMENATRISEEFLGVPFPTTDVIMLSVVPDAEGYDIGPGLHLANHSRVVRQGRALPYDIAYHEITHHYFTTGFGPVWLREGAAEFTTAYIQDRLGGKSMDVRREGIASGNGFCVSTGIENINLLNQLYDRVYDTPTCAYVMGEHFLHEANDLLGAAALTAALREFVALDSARGTTLPGTEEEVYRVFLRNTPPGREELFRNLYDRLHGGQRVDAQG